MTRAAALVAAALATLPAAAQAADLKVATTDPKGITTTTATLNADVDHAVDGGQVTWQYGPTTAYGATTLPVALAAQDARQQPSLPLSCLTPNTTYHVRAVATSGLVTVYGADKKLQTAKPVPGTAPASCPSSDPAAGSGSTGSSSGGSGSGSGTSGSGTSGSGSGTSGSGTSGSNSGTSGSGTSGDTSSSAAGGDGSGATTPPGAATKDVTPVLGATVAAAAVRGTVTAASASGEPVDLSEAAAVPTGTIIDTTRGAVELKTALDTDGHVQVARFWGGKFEVHQDDAHPGVTQIVLRGGIFAGCPAPGTARAASASTRKKSRPRSLWGSDSHGRYQTRGRGSVATVRGTRWLTQDRCNGTLTRVTAGAVAVRDLRRGTTVLVRKGHEYLARVAR